MKFRHVGALAAGFALDAVLGDPPGWPHPVRLIGKQIEFEEKLVRWYILPHDEEGSPNAAKPVFGKLFPASDEVVPLAEDGNWPLDRAQTEQLAGLALAADVMLCLPAATWLMLKLTDRIHPMLSFAVETVLFYQLIATRALQDESMAVYDRLKTGDLQASRAAVARIVGRDTDNLDEAGVARATVETIAENASDGVVAPMMYQVVGGAPMAMLYKAVNTLDSMVGYKNERYLNLGRASAIIDDAFNMIPARVTGVLMCVAAHLSGFDAQRAWEVFKRDRYNHTSPNSAQAEAACAGALQVQLGGPNTYGGVVVEKPTIGDDERPIEAEDIVRANRLLRVTAVVALAACACAGFIAGLAGGKK